MRGHERGDYAKADSSVTPVVEAQTEEEAPGRVLRRVLDEEGAEVHGNGVEDGAVRAVARDMGAVVVDDALKLLH